MADLKVLIANPPAYLWDRERFYVNAGSRWSFSYCLPKKAARSTKRYVPYPYFLAEAVALARRVDGVKVVGLDATALAMDQDEFIEAVKSLSPDVLVLEVPTITFPLVMEVLAALKRDKPDLTTVVVGPHITALWHEEMENYRFVDYAVVGEYPLPLAKLLESLARGEVEYEKLKKLKGIVFRFKGELVFTGRHSLPDPRELPLPDREFFRPGLYYDLGVGEEPQTHTMATRGCPMSCMFCLYRHVIYGAPVYRKRSVRQVVEELKILKHKWHVKTVYFDDDTMFADKSYVKELALEVIREKLDLNIMIMGDATIDRKTLVLLRKAGLVALKFGIETFGDEQLKKIGKGLITVNRIVKLRKWLRELDVFAHGTFMVGLPTDTREGVLATLKFGEMLRLDSFQVSIATPLPGTPFFKLCEVRGWLVTKNWNLYDGNNFAVVSYPHLSREEIERLHKLMRERLTRAVAYSRLAEKVRKPLKGLRSLRNLRRDSIARYARLLRARPG